MFPINIRICVSLKYITEYSSVQEVQIKKAHELGT